jgi:tetraacyldisaccharide-1-P 4'-kinase
LAFQARTHGAKALLTTEKDAMNLPENASALVEPLEIYWLKIETVLENELALLQIIESKLN